MRPTFAVPLHHSSLSGCGLQRPEWWPADDWLRGRCQRYSHGSACECQPRRRLFSRLPLRQGNKSVKVQTGYLVFALFGAVALFAVFAAPMRILRNARRLLRARVALTQAQFAALFPD